MSVNSSLISSGTTYTGPGSGDYDPAASLTFEIFDDLLHETTQTSELGWTRHQTATGISQGVESLATRPGIWQYSVTATGDEAGSYTGGPAELILTGSTAFTLAFAYKIDDLNDGTDDAIHVLGFGDTVLDPAQNEGIYFRYQAGNANWHGVTENAGIETSSDTGVAATTDWTNFRIEINAAGTSVTFYINGTLVATNTTNIPNDGAGDGMGITFQTKKTASGGTPAAVVSNVDWTLFRYTLPSARGTF